MQGCIYGSTIMRVINGDAKSFDTGTARALRLGLPL